MHKRGRIENHTKILEMLIERVRYCFVQINIS